MNKYKHLPEKDYDYEIEELKKENEKLQKEIKEKETFSPITEKHSYFESIIF